MARIILIKRKSFAVVNDENGNLLIPVKRYSAYKLAYRKVAKNNN